MNSLLQLVISSAALLCTAYFVPGFKVQSFGYAMLAALVIGVVNFLIRPVLLLLTLPINILTLGLFTLVINAICLKLAASLIPGFDIEGFGSAFIGAIILALINMLFHALLMPGTSQQV